MNTDNILRCNMQTKDVNFKDGYVGQYKFFYIDDADITKSGRTGKGYNKYVKLFENNYSDNFVPIFDEETGYSYLIKDNLNSKMKYYYSNFSTEMLKKEYSPRYILDIVFGILILFCIIIIIAIGLQDNVDHFSTNGKIMWGVVACLSSCVLFIIYDFINRTSEINKLNEIINSKTIDKSICKNAQNVIYKNGEKI